MLEIVKGGKADLPTVRQLAEVTFPHTYASMITPEQIDYMMEWMYSPESLRKQLDEGQQLFLLLCGEEAVGFMTVEPQEELLFHLQKIYVLPSQQGCGAGKRLINVAVEFVRSSIPEGKTALLELNVNRQNSAVGFYEKMGFVVDRQVDAHIGNGFYMTDYIMVKKITNDRFTPTY